MLDLGNYYDCASVIPLAVGDGVVIVKPKVFTSGSVGWYGTTKLGITLNGESYRCQAQVTVTVIGSKATPSGHRKAPEAQQGPKKPLDDPEAYKWLEAAEGAKAGQEMPTVPAEAASAPVCAAKKSRKSRKKAGNTGVE